MLSLLHGPLHLFSPPPSVCLRYGRLSTFVLRYLCVRLAVVKVSISAFVLPLPGSKGGVECSLALLPNVWLLVHSNDNQEMGGDLASLGVGGKGVRVCSQRREVECP